MCGIVGVVDLGGGSVDRSVLVAMGEAVAHRGPDEAGVWVEGPCGLAHRRLSIIDITGSQQPLVPANSHLALVYNGELYNYLELRSELAARGCRFETAGDTEALLRVLEEENLEGVTDRLDGMYAFGAWHRRERRLILARDPLGKKPLFYAQPRADLLVFASEIKALLVHPEVRCELDEDALRQALRFRAVYGQGCLYRGIRQLEPGSILLFDRQGVRTERCYLTESEVLAGQCELAGLDESAILERGRHLITDAVRKRLIADVPVGAFLSGGIDSSLIVALMQEIRRGEPRTHTFSVGFSHDDQSELPFAGRVAKALNTVHTEVELTPTDYASALTRVSAYRDAPISEPADIAIHYMSLRAKESVKVVLSGEGADEVFCGYPKFTFAGARAPLRFAARILGPGGMSTLAKLVGVDARRTRIAARALAGRSELDRIVQWFSYLGRSELDGLLPALGWGDDAWRATTSAQNDALQRFAGSTPELRMQIVDLLTWLPANLLERGDRMTMAAGLEARVPFLDPAVVRYGLGLPVAHKIRGQTLKWVVRRWARDLIPPEIVERPKWGFRVPLAQWFRGELRDEVHQRLLSSSGICGTWGDRTKIEQLLQSHDSGRQDESLSLWTLLAAEVWYQDVFLAAARGDTAA